MRWFVYFILLIAFLIHGCKPNTEVEETRAPRITSILWVTIDTTRADHLGAYGYFRDTSPHFDALAESSLLFERCIAPISTTLPSHLSALTGFYPNEHGVLANVSGGGQAFVPSEKLVSLAEFLQERKYATAAFISGASLNERTGIQRGFTDFNVPKKRARDGNQTTDRAIQWLDDHLDATFFLWVHLFDPHKPYRDATNIDIFSDKTGLKDYVATRQFTDTKRSTTGKLRNNALKAINRYDGEIGFADRQLGRLLDALRERGLYDETAIVVMGDHGEGLGQHGHQGHGYIWNEQLHVPLLFHVPGVSARRISQLISIVDVFPTLLGMIEVPDKAQFLADVSGIDALKATGKPRVIFSQSSLLRTKSGVPLTFSLTTENWKYFSTNEGEQGLFDFRVDPFELNDLSEKRPDKVDEFRAILIERIAQQRARNTKIGATTMKDLDKSTLEKLRALGYFDQ